VISQKRKNYIDVIQEQGRSYYEHHDKDKIVHNFFCKLMSIAASATTSKYQFINNLQRSIAPYARYPKNIYRARTKECN
jgi:hypothetical protein